MRFFERFGLKTGSKTEDGIEVQENVFNITISNIIQIKFERMGGGGLEETYTQKILKDILGDTPNPKKEREIRDLIRFGIGTGIQEKDIAFEIVKLKYPKFKILAK